MSVLYHCDSKINLVKYFVCGFDTIEIQVRDQCPGALHSLLLKDCVLIPVMRK